MKIRLTLALFIICIFLSAPKVEAQAPDWQMAQSASAQLGVRDKFGNLGSYQAKFTVTAPNGKKYSKTIEVNGSEFGYVNFPQDFDTPERAAGRFSWTCEVNGDVVVRGSFRLLMDSQRYEFPRARAKSKRF